MNINPPKPVVVINQYFQFVQFIAASFTIIAAALGIIYLYVGGNVIAVLSGFFSAALIVGILASIIVLRQKKTARDSDWNPYIWIKVRNSIVRVHDAANILYVHKMKIKILRSKESQFNFRVGWTGNGELLPWVKNPGFRCELAPAPADTAHILMLHFDRPRRKGDEIDIEFGIQTRGTDRIQEPFYSLTHYESRLPESAVIRVEFGDGLVVKSAQKEIYASDTAAWPLHPPEPIEIDKNRFCEWVVPKRAGQRYGIRWEYGNN